MSVHASAGNGCAWCCCKSLCFPRQPCNPSMAMVDSSRHAQHCWHGLLHHLPHDSATHKATTLPFPPPPPQGVRAAGGAGLLVADPPWENASARRAAAYASMSPGQLEQLPLGDLLRQVRGGHRQVRWSREGRLRGRCRQGLQHSHVTRLTEGVIDPSNSVCVAACCLRACTSHLPCHVPRQCKPFTGSPSLPSPLPPPSG
jgi:hypothetical protein